RIIRGRVFYHRDFVAKLSGKANRRLYARVCDQPNDNELMDAVLLELQIQVRVGETTGTPMLLRKDFAWLSCELAANLATLSVVFKSRYYPSRILNVRNELPILVVARTITMMHCIEDPKPRLPRRS